jgi:hypothetical protein
MTQRDAEAANPHKPDAEEKHPLHLSLLGLWFGGVLTGVSLGFVAGWLSGRLPARRVRIPKQG